jgi:hypothetical protein
MALGTNLPVYPAIIFTYFEPGKLLSLYSLLLPTVAHLHIHKLMCAYSIPPIRLLCRFLRPYIIYIAPTSYSTRHRPPTRPYNLLLYRKHVPRPMPAIFTFHSNYARLQAYEILPRCGRDRGSGTYICELQIYGE